MSSAGGVTIMSSTLSRRALLRRGAVLISVFGSASLAAACQQPAAPPAKPAETKSADSKPAETKPAAPAAQAQPTVAKPAEGKPAESAPAAQAPAVSKQLGGELRLNIRTGVEEDTMKEVLPKFTQDTGVQVKIETFPTAEYFTKMQTLIAGGTAGDVWYSIHRNTPRFAANKVILPLDDLVKADNYDLSQYYPSAVEASRRDGILWALPFKVHPGPAAMFYNVNHTQEAGVSVPENGFASWDALIAAGKTLTKRSGDQTERYGFQLTISSDNAANNLQTFVMYLRSWGTELYSPDGKKSLLNEPKAREAFRFMHSLMHEHKIAVTGQNFTSQSEDMMIAGRTAMMQGPSSLKSMPGKIGGKFEVKNVLMPPGPAGIVGTQTNTDHIVINAKTQNKEAAWELAKLMCGKEVGVRLGGGGNANASGTSGGRIDVFHDPRIMSNPLHPVWIPLVEKATPPIYPANLREEEVASAMHQLLGPLWLGERLPDDAFFAELNTTVQAVMDRPPA